MKYTHKMRDFVKEYASVREVCFLEGISFNGYGRAKCPICGGRGESFTIKESINNFKCWSCNKGGDGITLYSNIHNTDFKESVIALAERLGYKEDADIQVAKIDAKELKKVEIKQEEKKGLTAEQIELYNNVYEALSEVCGTVPADKAYVLNRGIKENKLKDFFSLRYITEGKLRRILNDCKSKYGYTVKDIAKVPGFYENAGNLKINPLYGLALKARNAEGKVIGIQVRTEFEECKYLWLSSDKNGGVSCGTPVSVDYPLNAIHSEKMDTKQLIDNSASTIFIGEGKFKGCIINQEFNSIAISLAGVNNWRGRVKQELDYINNIRPIKNMMICFDADMCYNFQIGEQFIKMVKEELESYSTKKVRVAIWDIRYGKGIDDMIENGFRSKLKSITFDEFENLYKGFREHSDKRGYTKDDKDERTELFNQYFNL
jgi:hypothetical protein